MTTLAQLNGLLKEAYNDSVENLTTMASILQQDIDFVKQSQKNGLNFNTPLVMSNENGFTYSAPNVTGTGPGGTIAMNDAISMVMVNAQVAPYQLSARWVLGYDSAERSAGQNAFERAALLQLTNVVGQAKNRLEMTFLYGQEGFGVASTSANVSATSTDLTFDIGTWADATFGMSLNAEVQFFDTVTGALVSSGADSKFIITRVNTLTRVVRVTGTATGITALDAAALAGAVDIFYSGSRASAAVFNEGPGISKIITNTGTLFNVDAAVYDLWKGNTYAAGGAALNFAKLQSAISLPIGKGLMEAVTVYVNPKTWGNLLTEQSALRMFDESYKTSQLENGATALKFFSQNGMMTIKSHPFVKQGDAFVIPTKTYIRTGSNEITMKGQGAKSEFDFFVDLQDYMGFQAKLYSAQTMFCEKPAQSVKISGIVNT